MADTNNNKSYQRCTNDFFELWQEVLLLLPQTIIYGSCLLYLVKKDSVGVHIHKSLKMYLAVLVIRAMSPLLFLLLGLPFRDYD